jgi:hypothetical protein
MTPLHAFRDGIRRVNRAPAIVISVWLLTALVALPLSLAMRDQVQQHLGASLEADTAARGLNYEWMQEFSSQATGFATTLSPRIVGFGAVLDNLSTFLDDDGRPVLIVSAAVLYLGLWIFLSGGIIDRYARDRAIRTPGFLWASGTYFARLLRLGLIAGAAYALLFRFLHPWFFDTLFEDATRDLNVERQAFLVRLLLYVVFGCALAAVNLLFDYAKVRAVVEDRRSMFGALVASVAFIRRNALAAATLYVLDVLLWVGVLGLYALVAPGAASAGWLIWFGFAIGQLYVAARVWVKLVFWASEAALFQGRLAHAGYVAAARPAWPESAAAEMVTGPALSSVEGPMPRTR